MARFYLIGGSDEFLVKERALALAGQLSSGGTPEEDEDFEIIRGDADNKNTVAILSDLLNALRTPPFFSERKVVWLRNFAGFEELQKETQSASLKSVSTELLSLLQAGLPAGMTLIWSGSGLDLRKSYPKKLKAAPDCEVESCNLPTRNNREQQAALQTRILELCRTNNKRLESPALDFIMTACSGDSAALTSELNKLFTYLGERETATRQDCVAVIARTPEAMGWELGSAILELDIARALSLIAELLRRMRSERSGNLELSLFYSISGAFTDLLETRRAMAELKVPARITPNYFDSLPQDLKEKYPQNMLLKIHPYRAFKLCSGAAVFSDKMLSEIFRELVKTNIALVGSSSDSRIAIEQLVISIGQIAKSRSFQAR